MRNIARVHCFANYCDSPRLNKVVYWYWTVWKQKIGKQTHVTHVTQDNKKQWAWLLMQMHYTIYPLEVSTVIYHILIA